MVYFELIVKWGQFFLLVFAVGFPLNLVVCSVLHSRRWWGDLAKALFVPGAILHELGHAIACLVTGKRIVGTNFGTNPVKGGEVKFLHTGICTPLAMHAIAFAPVISCGIVVAFILRHIALNQASFGLFDWVIWLFLLISVTAGAGPSIPDMRVAFHSLRERPRVTLVEVISLVWPAFLPDIIGVTSDWALITYLGTMIATYIVLWILLGARHPRGIRRNVGRGRSLLGDLPPLPLFALHPTQLPLNEGKLPRSLSNARSPDVTIPIATREDIYRAAGLKIKGKRGKHRKRGGYVA
ncbi:MAG: hypothetical protein RBG13Loki_0466 [Promethearchaeota archaeon CR_4]|nr:MAG: hypothetical protein RBG13Loki_0466 [Candidatus Lokiarchaeota archaeon CR_4]